MIKRLKIKFISITMVIVTAMLLVIFGMVLYFTRENLEQQSDQMLDTVESWFVESKKPEKPKEKPESETQPEEEKPKEKPREKGRELDINLPFFVVELNKQREIEDIIGRHRVLFDQDMYETVIRLALDSGEKGGHLWEYNLRYRVEPSPSGYTISCVDISSAMDTMQDLLATCATICIASFALFFGLSILLANWMVKPVEESWKQQKQFVADASHELKTPLTVIMTNADLLCSGDYSQLQQKQFSQNILSMSHQMRTLVESLLELARVDSGSVKTGQTVLNFSELVEGCVLPFEPVYFEKGLVLESRIAASLRIRGNASYLRQVVEILLDNAAKYSSENGVVSVILKKEGCHCLLSVANPGAAMDAEELNAIFKRFYRADKARSRDNSYGLGLSIAQSIVQEHGGKIWAESKNGVNTFNVQFNLV